MDELVNQILATDALCCTSCKKLLQTPVMLIKGMGNVCAKCYDTVKTQQDIEALENRTINTLLNTLEFPCQYEKNGCGKRLNSTKLHEHVLTCPFKTVECLLKPSCSWTGSRRALTQHFSRQHVNNVHTSEDDTFKLPFPATTDAKLLKTSVGTFMLYIKRDQEKAVFYLYDVDQHQDMKECKVKLTCSGANPEVSFTCKIVKDITLLIEADPGVGSEHLLTTLAGTEHVAVVFCGEDESNIKMGAPMLEILECLICKNYMRPPIYQCVKGHDICNACKVKIQACPLCQSQYTGTRNYSLEGLVGQMRYPCQYEDQGCSVRALASSGHDSVCNYRPWICPVENCGFKSFYSELLAHVEQHHAGQCVRGGSHSADHDWRLSLRSAGQSNGTACSQTLYFLAYHKLFELSFTGTSTKCTWKMDILAPKDDDSQYRVTICIEDANSSLGVATSGLCQYKGNENDYDHSLTIPTNTLAEFIREREDFIYMVTLEKARGAL